MKESVHVSGRPIIAVICGSTRQRADFERLNETLTREMKIVLSVGMFGHEIGLDMDGELKAALDRLHLRKIDMADEVHVILKPNGELGESTAREMFYATGMRKQVFVHTAGIEER